MRTTASVHPRANLAFAFGLWLGVGVAVTPVDQTPVTFQHIGILSLEFHVDKLSRPLL